MDLDWKQIGISEEIDKLLRAPLESRECLFRPEYVLKTCSVRYGLPGSIVATGKYLSDIFSAAWHKAFVATEIHPGDIFSAA